MKPRSDEEKYKKKFILKNYSPSKISLSLSKLKAKKTSLFLKNKLVVGADTIISINGKILGKAKTIGEAKEKIKKLSGKKHLII